MQPGDRKQLMGLSDNKIEKVGTLDNLPKSKDDSNRIA
jgi:hypothetical protein